MDKFWWEVIASLTRKVGPFISGILIGYGILTPEQGDRFTVELLKVIVQYGPVIAAAVWGIWSTYMKRLKLNTALEMPPTTEAQVATRIENGMGAKVL